MATFYLTAVVAVFIASLAQILLKSSSFKSYGSLIKEYLNWKVIVGYTLLFGSMLINIYALSKGLEVKELASIESLSYLLVPVLSYLFFGERVPRRRLVAIIAIMVGIVVFFS